MKGLYPTEWMEVKKTLWNVSEEGEDVRSQCEEDKGTNCDDGDSFRI
jgi:hypothetical protein